jgi:hypothetical protein
MRIRAMLFGLSLAPAVTSAQLANRPDSAGLAWAIAGAIRAPIQKNGAPRSTMIESATISPLSKLWNARVGRALKSIDSTLVARRPTKETMRVNVVELSMFGDSATANVAISRCYAERFVGSSAVYSFKRKKDEWVVVHQERGMAARGPCPKGWGAKAG